MMESKRIFYVGDLIQIVSGPHEGKWGHIIANLGDDYDCEVQPRQRGCVGLDKVVVKFEDIELITPALAKIGRAI